MINSNNFEYFLNAIHYSLWIGDMKFGDFMGKVVDILLFPYPSISLRKNIKRNIMSVGKENKKDR